MKILSSAGFQDFSGFIDQGISETLYLIRFVSGNEIKATGDHRFLQPDGNWIDAELLMDGDELLGDIVESIHIIDNERVYDALDVGETHDYYTNGVISHNCNFLYVDEAAIIPNTVADEFFTATYPTISAGKTTKIALTSTPLGLNHFWKFWAEAEAGTNGFTPVRVEYTEHPEHDEKWANEQLQLLGELKYRQEVLMDFLGSSATLIRPDAIQKMAVLKPIYDKEGMAIYFPPEKGRLKEGSGWETKPGSYIITVDTAAGVGGDSSSFSVIRVDQLPYVQVARYANNTISPLLYPNIIRKIAMEYNEAWVLIEINKSEQVPYILYNELEYENIIYVRRDIKGQTVSAGFSGQGKTQFGVMTDKKTKWLGCSMFKTLVEESKLLIHDPLTISEISTFIADNKGSYSADDGCHDDTVMTLVLFGWLTGNAYFKELTDIDIRTNIYKLRMDLIEQEILPVGFRVDGNEDHEPNTEGWVEYTPM